MFPNDFAYAAPRTLDEAIQLLQANPDAKVLAGGHSLLPLMKTRLAAPPMLVDIGKIADLRRIAADGVLHIGATVTYHEIEHSTDVAERCPLLVETARNIGDPQVRNRGTLGGALAHSDPAADMTAVLLALGGDVKARGPRGERTIPADDLFVDMLQTQLEPDEILTEITIPQSHGRTGMAYEKFAHPASGYAIVGVAAVVQLGGDGTVSACRIGVTGAGPKAQRAAAAEKLLSGKTPTADTIAAAAAQADSGLDLLSDLAGSEEYRAHLVRVQTRRALERAVTNIR
ncbi:MAG TPA: xanthine dehydrogenase family protein subunit M [Herpetosiphonaceae bacterium]|nr:xanthine dehydrogenase family protein subunit M [Herpetosiphonaceae bacterium]